MTDKAMPSEAKEAVKVTQGASAAPVPETMDGLRAQNRAYRTLCASLEAQMAITTEKGRQYQEAVTTLDSEREANAILTDEITALRATIAKLEAGLSEISMGGISAVAAKNIARALLSNREPQS